MQPVTNGEDAPTRAPQPLAASLCDAAWQRLRDVTCVQPPEVPAAHEHDPHTAVIKLLNHIVNAVHCLFEQTRGLLVCLCMKHVLLIEAVDCLTVACCGWPWLAG